MEVRSYSGIERNEHEHNNIKNLEIIMFNEKKKNQTRMPTLWVHVYKSLQNAL